MANIKQRIVNCLWFDSQAEEAVQFYTSIFKNSSIGAISRYGKEGFEFHKKPEGAAMTVSFILDGQQFLALNGGPQFKFTEAISLMIMCQDQKEVDYYWDALTEGGEESWCGWLKDKYGLSWQVVPDALDKMLTDPDKAKTARVTKAFLQMRKFNIAELEKAYNG